MPAQTLAPSTPITPKADRSDRRIRMLEEAVLMLRGQWPSAATGLCMSVNSLYGFTLTGKQARRRMVNESVAEALRLVEALYGANAIAEVYQRATADEPDQRPSRRPTPPKSPGIGGRPRALRPAMSLFHRGARLT
jgi:hypothetical protein